MSALLNPLPAPEVDRSVAFVEDLFKIAGAQSFAVRLWTGETLRSRRDALPEFTIVLKHPGALRRMFSPASELSLGEGYIFDDYDLEGDIEAAVRLGKFLAAIPASLPERVRLRFLISSLPSGGPPRPPRAPRLKGRVHSRRRDQAAIRYHYDTSNEFYSLFLDSRMLYSAGHFCRPDDDLDLAQERKLDRICRLLDLHPGERFLDVGCGWGGLIIYAAQKFGVDALGITLSERQAQLARERIGRAGLEGRCRVEIRDYRDLDRSRAFHKIASVGMIEHVGAAELPTYFRAVARLLAPGGKFLNSGITRPPAEPAQRQGSFTEKYVFPDGELETIPQTLQAAEDAGLELRLAENVRQDYALTLRHWVRRLEAHAGEARRIAEDVSYRIWRLYMAGSAARFADGELYLLLALFTRIDADPGIEKFGLSAVD